MDDKKLVEQLIPLWEKYTEEGLEKAADVLGVSPNRIAESPEHYTPLMMGALLRVCAEEIEKANARIDELERAKWQREDFERQQADE